MKNNGGPAFPRAGFDSGGDAFDGGAVGMSLRDYFAAAALQAILTSDVLRSAAQQGPRGEAAELASAAYMFADAMLAERSK